MPPNVGDRAPNHSEMLRLFGVSSADSARTVGELADYQTEHGVEPPQSLPLYLLFGRDPCAKFSATAIKAICFMTGGDESVADSSPPSTKHKPSLIEHACLTSTLPSLLAESIALVIRASSTLLETITHRI